MPKGKAGALEDKVGDNDKEDETNNDPLGRPSVISSGNQDPSECSRISQYSSTSASTRVLPLITARSPPNELILPADQSATLGGPKLCFKPPHTQIALFIALVNRDELEGENLKGRAARNEELCVYTLYG